MFYRIGRNLNFVFHLKKLVLLFTGNGSETIEHKGIIKLVSASFHQNIACCYGLRSQTSIQRRAHQHLQKSAVPQINRRKDAFIAQAGKN